MKRKPIKIVQSIREIMTQAVESQPLHIAYRYWENGSVTEVTNLEFFNSVENLGTCLCRMGYEKSHIACLGANSYPWIQTFLCVLQTEGVFIPLDCQLPEAELLYLLNDSDTEVLFCEAKFEDMIRKNREKIPALKTVVCFERERNEGDYLSFRQLLAYGDGQDRTAYDRLKSDPNALKYLVYTSGTTGIAKGVMLTEHNIVSGVCYGLMVSRPLTVGLSVLPYHHTYEAVCDLLVGIHAHTTLCINDSLKRVGENLKRYQPDFIYFVPAFAEFFYQTIQKKLRKSKKEKQFARLVLLSERLRKVGIDLRRILFAPILKELGGNLRKIVCGGAPIRPEIGKFFDEIGITLTGGYGITECSPLVSVNDDKTNNFSSAGHRLPCLEWRIDSPDAEGIGEICVRGDVVMRGYYKRQDLTAEAIRDGWFYTGDYGFLNEKDEVVITGRKKNVIILSNGKNVYPEEIEMHLCQVPDVTEAVVRGFKNGNGEEVALSAEIYSENPDVDPKSLRKSIREALSGLPYYKQVAELSFRTEPFEKTTTNKIKR